MISEEFGEHLANVCKILNAHDVEYMVVGGAAVSHYGFNRPSGVGQENPTFNIDLDFWYNPTIENFQNIVDSLDQLGIETADLNNLIFDRGRTFLKIPFENFHMDFLPQMVGLRSFREHRVNSALVEIRGIGFQILSLEDLISNKRAVNRTTDRHDISELYRLKKKTGN